MKNLSFVVAVLVSVISQPAGALTASIFTLDVPGGSAIDLQKDHMTVVLENGWISTEKGFLEQIFSEAKSGLFRITAKTTFRNNKTVELESTTLIDDPKGSMGRSLGQRGPVYPDMPADVRDLEFTLRIATTQDDRIKKLLDNIESNKAALPVEVFTAQWFGYARLVSTVTQALFGTNDTDYPLTGRYRLTLPTKEHLILFVAPNEENDKKLRNAKATDFEYKEREQQLFFRNEPVRKWTYLVFKIKKSNDKRSAEQRVKYDAIASDTPWATVIRTQLRVLRADKAKDVSQLTSVADNALSAIQNLETFLGVDLSYSNFDRGSTLKYYTEDAIGKISKVCKKRKYSECPTEALQEYSNAIADSVGIPETKLAEGVGAIKFQTIIESKIRSGELKASARMRASILPTLGDIEHYLATNPEALESPTKSVSNLQKEYARIESIILREKFSRPPVGMFSTTMGWDPKTRTLIQFTGEDAVANLPKAPNP